MEEPFELPNNCCRICTFFSVSACFLFPGLFTSIELFVNGMLISQCMIKRASPHHCQHR